MFCDFSFGSVIQKTAISKFWPRDCLESGLFKLRQKATANWLRQKSNQPLVWCSTNAFDNRTVEGRE